MLSNRTRPSGADNVYPEELRAAEAAAIAKRRAIAGGDGVAPDDAQATPNDLVALALSGGGIRSATFALGVVQAMARHGVLRKVDLLSTVSGGGFLGGFLGRMFDRLRGAHQPVRRAEEVLANTDSRPLRWLRRHGKYIAPEGSGDLRLNIAIALRNFLTLHAVLFAYLFAAFGVLNVARYGLVDPVLGAAATLGELPGTLAASALGAFWSPWFMAIELIALLWLLPLLLAYWLVSADKPRAFQPAVLALAFVALLSPYVIAQFLGSDPRAFVLAGIATAAFVAAQYAWWSSDKVASAVGTGGEGVDCQRPRQFLTMTMSDALLVLGGLLVFALADTVGHALQQYARRNYTYVEAFATLGSVLAVGLPMIRSLANGLLRTLGMAGSGALQRLAKLAVVRQLLVVPVALVPLVATSFAAHAAFDGGSTLAGGALATAFALAFSIWLAFGGALHFINRTSMAPTYALRLGRAYLGATNPARGDEWSGDVNQLVPGDNVADLENYRPHEAGGPVHIINVCLNQTYDRQSPRGTRDRKGENLAVHAFGLSVGRDYHAAWQAGSRRAGRQSVLVMGRQPGRLHPFVAYDRNPDGIADTTRPSRLTVDVERLSLQDWIGVSGAAFGPGVGARTDPLTALLTTLANVRLGRWWDSGLELHSRVPSRPGFLRRLTEFAGRLLLGQTLLISEASARFGGPWHRYWYLSDGGYFENLGLYEVVRRRPAIAIAVDATADPAYRFEDLAEFVRKARIDFASSVEPFTKDDLDSHVPHHLRHGVVGTVDELRAKNGENHHATLFWVRHPATASQPAATTVLLYVKASLVGGEPIDVRSYAQLHPDFPQQSTADQFYDEQQWESYRRLGEHIGTRLFSDDPWWLGRIPVGLGA